MSTVEDFKTVEELENKPLEDNVFSFNSSSIKVKELQEWNVLDTPREFIGLTEEEKDLFNKFGIDGDNLRVVNGRYIDLYGNSYHFDRNGKMVKDFVSF